MPAPVYCATADEAVAVIESNSRIYIHGMAAAPRLLMDALADRARELTDITFFHLHCEGIQSLCQPELNGHIFHHCYFVDQHTRPLIELGMAGYAPVFLSEVPKLFRHGIQPIDVALIQVSPPDKHGICSLGISVEATRAACEAATTIIAHMNPSMPRTHGDSFIHISKLSYVIEQTESLSVKPIPEPDAISQAIGENIASLIPDGACLQMGIGAIPDAVLNCLYHHRHLGIHTEMFSDGVLPLLEKGIIDNSRKKIHPGKSVTSFVLGSEKLYQFVDDNPVTVFLDSEYVNDTVNIRRNPAMIAINSAIEVDLTGQVCADSIGSRIYSGFGGQMDFVRGASLSPGGKAIIALPSTAASGLVSRIKPCLTEGAGVVTTRAHVHFVVTEYGIADLQGKTLQQRAKALSRIAHPAFRDQLTQVTG